MAKPRISYVNGRYLPYDSAYIHIEDRGILFSDGVYEGILIKDNTLIDFDLHLERLKYSLDVIKIDHVMSVAAIKNIIRQLQSRNKSKDGFVYLQVTRGTSPRNHVFPKDSTPSLIITIHPPRNLPQKIYDEGAKIIIRDDNRWARKDAKTISLLPNILVKEEAAQEGALEAWQVKNGVITEGGASNAFIVDKNGVLRTHKASHDILGGIVRKRVIQLAKENNIIDVQEEAFTEKDVYEAREVFGTSTTMKIVPITKIEESKISDGKPGKITLELSKLYEEMMIGQINSGQDNLVQSGFGRLNEGSKYGK